MARDTIALDNRLDMYSIRRHLARPRAGNSGFDRRRLEAVVPGVAHEGHQVVDLAVGQPSGLYALPKGVMPASGRPYAMTSTMAASLSV